MKRIRILLPIALIVLFSPAFLSSPAFAQGTVSVHVETGWPGWVGWWYPPPPAGVYGPEYVPADAAIDTDIHPEEAEVWLDGHYIGIADQFDGFPRYLRVAPGEHRLEFRLEGYRSLVVDLDARTGRLYGLDRWLRQGRGPEQPLPPRP
jgi:hypothetical protein